MKGQSKTLIALVVIFVLLNIWLLQANYVRQDQIDYLLSLQNELFHKNIESEAWGFEQAGSESAVIIHPEVEIPKTGLSMAVFFYR